MDMVGGMTIGLLSWRLVSIIENISCCLSMARRGLVRAYAVMLLPYHPWPY